MNSKFELLKDDTKKINGITLFRIRALVAIGSFVAPGDLGGYIESEKNISVYGNAWVYGNALVYGNARVFGDARVYGDALVYGNARVYGDALVYGNARVFGDARVYGDARVFGDARVYGNARVFGDARVSKTHHCVNITSQKFNLTFTPQNVVGGCRLFTHEEFASLTVNDCREKWEEWELDNYKGYQVLYLERLDKLK